MKKKQGVGAGAATNFAGSPALDKMHTGSVSWFHEVEPDPPKCSEARSGSITLVSDMTRVEKKTN